LCVLIAPFNVDLTPFFEWIDNGIVSPLHWVILLAVAFMVIIVVVNFFIM
jgi:predicted ABC-type sugar transport system permease subunit